MPDLERLAGRVLCVGLPGPEADGALLARLRRLGPGAIVLFARNVESVAGARALVGVLRAALASDGSIAVCVDQEGGRVARIPLESPMPAMLALGATDDPALAERVGRALAATLRAIDADVAFAPVLDLATNHASTVIGTRSLGEDPVRVAVLGAALVRGLQAGGVVATPKHFPGHGATAADSHTSLPRLDAPLATLRAREWEPFRAAFAAGARAVMTAHVVAPELDPARPATLSARVLGALREELGFAGTCFTDCLEMAAVAEGFGTARAGVLALRAGADCLVVSADLDRAEELRVEIVRAVRAGTLPLARLERAAARVASLVPGRTATGEPDPSPIDAAAVAKEVAARAIVTVRGEPRIVAGSAATVISFEGGSGDGVAASSGERPSLSAALRRRRVRSEAMRVPLDPSPGAVEALLDVLGDQPGRSLAIVTRRAHLYAGQRATIGALLAAFPHAIVVSALEPYDLAASAAARHVACTFGDDATTIDALADALVSGAR